MQETAGKNRESLRRFILIAVGLGCMLAYSRAFATGFAGSLPMAGEPAMADLSAACSMARVAAVILMVVAGCALRVSIGRLALALCGAAMAISAFALSGGCTVAEGMPFALLAGVSSGIVMLAMFMLLSHLDIRDIVVSSLGGLFVGGALIGGLMRLDALPALAILIASGLVSALFFLVVDPRLESCKADGLPNGKHLAAFPWFASIAFIVGGIVSSLFYGAFTTLGWDVAGQVNYPLFGVSIVLVLGATVYIVLQGEEAVAAAWVPLFSVILLSMALACFNDAELAPSVAALLLASVFSYHFLRWMVLPALISFSGVPRMLACGIVLVLTSSFFGVGWGASTAAMLPEGLREQGGFVAFIALMLLVVLAAALWVNRARLESERMQRESLGIELDATTALLKNAQERLEQLSSQIELAPEPAPMSLDDRCAALADKHGLTAREAEIFLLTARGHSSTFIAEQLFISASTVRFHQQNIYRKFDIHSRQDLLALVNDEEAS